MKILLILIIFSTINFANAQVGPKSSTPKIEVSAVDDGKKKILPDVKADELLATKLEVILYKKALIEKTYENDMKDVLLEQQKIGDELFSRAKISNQDYEYNPGTRLFTQKKIDRITPQREPSGATIRRDVK